jgi:hypothetical protein
MKRYDWDYQGLYEKNDGGYVHYEDARDLELLVERLTKERNALKAALIFADERINRERRKQEEATAERLKAVFVKHYQD